MHNEIHNGNKKNVNVIIIINNHEYVLLNKIKKGIGIYNRKKKYVIIIFVI